MGMTEGAFERPVLSRFTQAVDQFCAAPDAEDWSTLADELVELRRLVNLLELRFARSAAAFDAVHDSDSIPAVHWLRDSCHMTTHAAWSALQIGELGDRLVKSKEAVVEGRIGTAHLSWLADTGHHLLHSATGPHDFDEMALLPAAERLNVNPFRRRCRQLIHAADRVHFLHAEKAAVDERSLELEVFDDGSVHLDAWLDAEGGAVVRTALEPLAARNGSDDDRCVAKRRADALVELCELQLDAGTLPLMGGQRPHLHVTATIETLCDLAGSPAAETESGALLSGTALARHSCDSTIVRVLVNSRSEVIDVGRAARVVPPATRRALVVRDGGCVWPGCQRRASQTRAHHLLHWAHGGLTNADNLVLLCARHHWMVHGGGRAIVRTDDGRILVFQPLDDWHHPSGRDPAAVAA